MRLAAIRQFHAYLGAFIAPSILFFAATGALQLFSLHEAHGSYQPPLLIEKLSAVHKDQRFWVKAEPAEPAEPAAKGAPGEAAEHVDADHHHHDHAGAPHPGRSRVLKWMFLVVAGGLILSTCLGLWMALTYSRRKGVIWALLILGGALPVLILTV